MSELESLIPSLKEIAKSAGKAILEVYHASGEIAVETKSDDSPVTKADHTALKSLPIKYPVLSEEGGLPNYDTRKKWDRYWLVDPLDGTKEFINKNDEFTVNIALIEGSKAILGIVYVPVTGVLYYGLDQKEANISFAIKETNNSKQELSVAKVSFDADLVAVGSRRHGAEALDALLKNIEPQFSSLKLVSMGSSLKICAIAEGSAHWYPRLALTSEWDTAAAHAVLNGAGGSILNEDLDALDYNQKDSLLNPYFHAIGDQEFDWKSLIKNSKLAKRSKTKKTQI
jgi:3'(2'), 5'-bisphosphate nucleotidase